MVRKGAYTELGGDCYFYDTCIFTRLPDGRSVGNVTKYSRTTSKHQGLAHVRAADIICDDIQRGTTAEQLRAWATRAV